MTELGLALLCGVIVVVIATAAHTRQLHPSLVRRVGPIETDRLRLRFVTSADADALEATVDDDVITANGLVPEKVRHTHEQLRTPGATLPHAWVITERGTGAVLGIVSARPRSTDPRTCELGWWIGPAGRGRGHATEAVQAAIAALHANGIAVVRVGTRPDNVAIQRILEKVGAVRVADTPHTLPDGEVITSWWYEHRS